MPLKNTFDIDISEFNYALPEEKIALFPANPRDSSKLLHFNKADNKINQLPFNQIAECIEPNSLLILNNTKVIPVRLIFTKETGASIEIFCLEPHSSYADYSIALCQKNNCLWKCLIGNRKKWKDGTLEKNIQDGKIKLSAKIIEHLGETDLIEFSWNDDVLSFAEILDITGKIPLPPYIKRDTIGSDSITYQTVYAKNKGSVAAPTAGLHFTEEIFTKLQLKGIEKKFVSLHVGAGTFKPVSTEKILEHQMHHEVFTIEKNVIENIYNHIGKENTIAVGTTSVRTIESLYYVGLQLSSRKITENFFLINQWEPYKNNYKPITPGKSLEVILDFLENNHINFISGSTGIMIAPGYNYKLMNGMITNFHQPKSTLLLLVSAFIGSNWKEVYDFALENNFRFLSYGDACFFN